MSIRFKGACFLAFVVMAGSALLAALHTAQMQAENTPEGWSLSVLVILQVAFVVALAVATAGRQLSARMLGTHLVLAACLVGGSYIGMIVAGMITSASCCWPKGYESSEIASELVGTAHPWGLVAVDMGIGIFLTALGLIAVAALSVVVRRLICSKRPAAAKATGGTEG
jgi:hypothetical protein